MYRFIKQLLFLQEPEQAHHTTMSLLETAHKTGMLSAFVPKADESPITLGGIHFPSRVGLAAGFDKDAKHVHIWKALGFGHVEVGTLTPRPQIGNPQPRLFRLPADAALINRMGFNNKGVDVAAARLANRPIGIVVGGNIGKNKDTPPESAPQDYASCAKALSKVVDYLTINVSSPNTPGLRDLQTVAALGEIIDAVQTALHFAGRPDLPLFVKLAPDLANDDLLAIADLASQKSLTGLVATNTTISRLNLDTPPVTLEAMGAGGLSGAPLRARGLEVLQILRERLPRPFVLISSGGVDSEDAARERVAAGADLIQLYTGFIYEGPGLVSKVSKAFA